MSFTMKQQAEKPLSVDFCQSWMGKRVHLLQYRYHITQFSSTRSKNMSSFEHRSCASIELEFKLVNVDSTSDPYKTFCDIIRAAALDCAPTELAVYAITVTNDQEVSLSLSMFSSYCSELGRLDDSSSRLWESR
jgi:hypothetical protein